MGKEEEISKLRQIVKLHLEGDITDKTIPSWLPLTAPLIIILGIILFLFLPLFVPISCPYSIVLVITIILYLTVIIGGLASIAYPIYRLVKARNEHLDRTGRMYILTSELLSQLGIGNPHEILRKAEKIRSMSSRRSVKLYVGLALLTGPFSYYIYYLLNKDISTHSHLEKDFIDTVNSAIKKLHRVLQINTNRLYVVGEKSLTKNIILTTLTFGAYSIYWLRNIIKDYNNHFKSHREVERQLIDYIKEAITLEKEETKYLNINSNKRYSKY